MASKKDGADLLNMADVVMHVVRYLRANGFIVDRGRGSAFVPPRAPIHVQNDSGEEIPAFACLQAVGTTEKGGQNYINVDKPADTTGNAGWYLFNGVAPIESGGYGIAYDGPLCRMLTDGSAITAGERWQPVVNDWTVEPGGEIFIAAGSDDIDANVMRGFIAASGGGGGRILMGKVTAQGVASSGDWNGLNWVDVTVIWGPDALIATTVRIYDHSGDILDLDDLDGFSVWAAETRAHTLDTSKDCDVLTPLFWAAVNRGCTPNNQTYRTCEGY